MNTLFIHGFNNSFEDAILRAAQIGYDLGIGQGIGLFSWPSQGVKTPKGYTTDEATAEASKYLLADFIEQFVHTVPEKTALARLVKDLEENRERIRIAGNMARQTVYASWETLIPKVIERYAEIVDEYKKKKM
jgi:esterase/lipase superfamily enzyme